jgi:RNA polymerase sigma factor (sigma-70 family)
MIPGKQILTKNSMLLEKEFLSAIREHEKIIWKVISMYQHNPGDREDLRQEILLNAWKGSKNFRGDAKFSTWLYQVALNTAITFYKKDLRESEMRELQEKPDETNHADMELLDRAISSLSRVDKALVMLFLEDYSYAEIAAVMGITANNVAVKMNRIKSRLKQKALHDLNS